MNQQRTPNSFMGEGYHKYDYNFFYTIQFLALKCFLTGGDSVPFPDQYATDINIKNRCIYKTQQLTYMRNRPNTVYCENQRFENAYGFQVASYCPLEMIRYRYDGYDLFQPISENKKRSTDGNCVILSISGFQRERVKRLGPDKWPAVACMKMRNETERSATQ